MGKFKKILPAIIWDIQVAAELIMTLFIVRLNILPDKYLVLLLGGAVLVLSALSGFFLLRKTKDPEVLGWFTRNQLIGIAIAIVTIIAGIVASVMAYQAKTAIDEIVAEPVEEKQEVLVTHMGVYVMNTTAASAVGDIADETYGFLSIYNSDWNTKAKEFIEDEIAGKNAVEEEIEEVEEEAAAEKKPGFFDILLGKNKEEPEPEETEEPKTSIATKDLESIFTMADELYAGTTKVIVMDQSYVEVLSDVGTADEETETENPYANFATDTRMILEIPIYAEPSEVVEKDITSDPFMVYVSGSDTRSKSLSTSRSDVNILAVVNPVTYQVLMINTPRDTYVENPAGGNAMDKLTHCGIYGIDNSMQALGQLYGCEVDNFVQINFTGFEQLIDAMGGITVNSDMSFRSYRYGGPYNFTEGPNELTGNAALAFARERYAVAGGDETRGRHQMMVIEAVIDKVTANPSAMLSNYTSILSSLEGMIATDFTGDDISALVKLELDKTPDWNIKTYAISGTGDSAPNYSMSGVRSYVMHPDSSDVAYAKKLISKVTMGEILSDEDMNKESAAGDTESTDGTADGDSSYSDSSYSLQSSSSY